MNFDFMINNPLLIIIIVAVSAFAGRYVFVSKDDEKKLEKDMNCQSQKIDTGLNSVRQECTGALHNLQLNMSEGFGQHSEKIRIVQKEIMDEVDRKYLSKEMNRKQEERIEKMDEVLTELRRDVSEMKPYMEKIDLIYDVVLELKK